MTATTSKLGADTMDQKTQMREGFEAQRKAGMNVDWFTWQIAWHDALFTVHDIAGDALARQPAAIDKQDARNVDGMTRAEFEQHLRVCLQHDNVRRKERGIPEMTVAAMDAEIKERVERNYPAKCPGCAAFDNAEATEVHFVQGCDGCKARMQKVAGFGPLCESAALLARQPAAIDKQEARDAFDAWNDSQTALEFEDAEAENHARFIFTAGYIAAPVDTEASKPAAPMPAFNPLARMASGPELQERLRIISSKSMDAECSRLVDEEFFNLIDGAAPSVEQDERGAFEVALKRGVFDVDRVSDFNNCETEAAWRGWQARAASSANVAQGAEAVAIKCASDYASMTSGSQQPCDAPNCDCVPPEPTYYWRDAAGNCYGADPQPTLYAWKAPVQAPPAQTALTDDARDAIRRAALQDAHSAVRRCINVRDAEDAISALTAAQSASASKGKDGRA